MTRAQKWIVAAGVLVLVCAVGTLFWWETSDTARCTYHEEPREYSPDRKFWTQMQFTYCAEKTRSRLVMGTAGKSEIFDVLHFGPYFGGQMDMKWHGSEELDVEVPEQNITAHFSLSGSGLPLVLVRNPPEVIVGPSQSIELPRVSGDKPAGK